MYNGLTKQNRTEHMLHCMSYKGDDVISIVQLSLLSGLSGSCTCKHPGPTFNLILSDERIREHIQTNMTQVYSNSITY